MTNDPRDYVGVLDIPEGTSGPMCIKHIIYPAGHALATFNARTGLFGETAVKQTMTFAQPTRWHQLCEGQDGVWMTDLPIEQAQIRPLLARLSGRVLVGGLGLGFATTILARNPNVTEIVVVERSGDVIALVAPHVANPKLRVEHNSIEDYLRKPGGQFDSAFYDTWASDGQTTFFREVLPLRRASRGIVRGPVLCWNEDVMRMQLYFDLISVVLFLWNDPQYHERMLDQWYAPLFLALRNKSLALDERIPALAKLFTDHYGMDDEVDKRDADGAWVPPC